MFLKSHKFNQQRVVSLSKIFKRKKEHASLLLVNIDFPNRIKTAGLLNTLLFKRE